MKPSPQSAKRDRPVIVRVDTASFTVAIGSRKITVPGEPAHSVETTFRACTLRQTGPDTLVLKPSWALWVFAIAMALCGLGLCGGIGGLIIGGPGRSGSWVGLVLGIFFGLAFAAADVLVLLYSPRVCFDRRRGKLIRQSFSGRRERPLSEVIIVQLNSGGTRTRYDPSTRSLFEFSHTLELFELNLIFDDPTGGVYGPDGSALEGMTFVSDYLREQHGIKQRLNLCCHSDQRWVRRAGQQIAEFLGVPLVDHTSSPVSGSPRPQGPKG